MLLTSQGTFVPQPQELPVKGPATLVKAWMLESFVYPRLGSSAGQCDHCRGTHETAHQTKQRCSQIFRDALATGRAVRDITVDLRGALAPVVSESHAAITNPAKIGALLRAIDATIATRRLRLL